MNERELVKTVYAVGDQTDDLWPVSEVLEWNDGTATLRFVAAFIDHETADQFCRVWGSRKPLPTDEAGFRH